MKVDFKQEIAAYTAPRGAFVAVTVPPLQFLMIDGHGDPNSSARYAEALTTLFPMAYTLKFFSKMELGRDYTVMPLEGLWWSEDMATFTQTRDKARWSWTLMNLVPDWITPEHVAETREKVGRKGSAPTLGDLRLEQMDEGLCVQTLHRGPYDDEGPVLEAMHQSFIPGAGLQMTGRHHEIYLSDVRRTAPHRLRTILRQPVEPVGQTGGPITPRRPRD